MVIRKLDDVGRIVIPKEMREVLTLEHGKGVAIKMEGGRVFLEKHSSACCVCEGTENKLMRVNRAFLCNNCYGKLA